MGCYPDLSNHLLALRPCACLSVKPITINRPLMRVVRHLRPEWICGLFVFCASAAIAEDQEPSYNGRLLSQWLGDMRLSAPGSGPYEGAIRGMGTNAIPTLLKWMSYEPSPAELSREIEENVVHWRPVTNLNRYPAQRAERAGYAFCYLGAVARATIPELTWLARTASNLKRADRFAGALASIGRRRRFPISSPWRPMARLGRGGLRLTRWEVLPMTPRWRPSSCRYS